MTQPSPQKVALYVLPLVAVVGIGLAVFHLFFKEVPPVTVKIGVLLPSTPDLMTVAAKMRNGMELAREDLQEKYQGGVKIDIAYASACFEQETAPAVQKFIQEDVAFIGGSFCLFGHIPILPLTEANRMLTFNTASNPDVVLHRHYAFSTNIEIKDQAREMADFAYTTLGGRRAVFMHLDTPFGHDYNKYFTRRFEALGGRVLFNLPEAPDARDFRDIVAKIKAAEPDLIVTAHFGVPLGLFFKALREAGIPAPILGDYETEDQEVLDVAGSAAEGVIFASTAQGEKTAAMTNFTRRYIRRFGQEPDLLAANSYDDIVLGVACFLKCQGDRECMGQRMHQITNYQGASGVITIKQSGATDKPAIFKMIKNRTFIDYQGRSLSP